MENLNENENLPIYLNKQLVIKELDGIFQILKTNLLYSNVTIKAIYSKNNFLTN